MDSIVKYPTCYQCQVSSVWKTVSRTIPPVWIIQLAHLCQDIKKYTDSMFTFNDG